VERIRTALAEREQGIRPPDTRLTVAAFVEDWLEAQSTRVRPRTIQSYRDLVRLYVAPSLGAIRWRSSSRSTSPAWWRI
jgi:hypothetical protein